MTDLIVSYFFFGLVFPLPLIFAQIILYKGFPIHIRLATFTAVKRKVKPVNVQTKG